MNVVLTALGVFLCSAIACESSPAGLSGYFQINPPALAITTESHRPVRSVGCEMVPGRWPTPMHGPLGPTTLWRCDGDGGDPDLPPPGS